MSEGHKYIFKAVRRIPPRPIPPGEFPPVNSPLPLGLGLGLEFTRGESTGGELTRGDLIGGNWRGGDSPGGIFLESSLRRDSNLGELDFQVVHDEIAQKKSKRKTSYQKYSEEDRFKIGKYASENGAAAAVRKIKKFVS